MRTRSIKKIKILLLSSILLICSMTACGSDGEDSISIVYNVNENNMNIWKPSEHMETIYGKQFFYQVLRIKNV